MVSRKRSAGAALLSCCLLTGCVSPGMLVDQGQLAQLVQGRLEAPQAPSVDELVRSLCDAPYREVRDKLGANAEVLCPPTVGFGKAPPTSLRLPQRSLPGS